MYIGHRQGRSASEVQSSDFFVAKKKAAIRISDSLIAPLLCRSGEVGGACVGGAGERQGRVDREEGRRV
jgi:hypothetical protein